MNEILSPDSRKLALAARQAGRREEALGYFRAAAQADPRDLWNRHDVAVELRELGRTDAAANAFRQVVHGTPLAHALRGLAQIARAGKDDAKALDLFRAASALLPADPWFALDVATTLRTLGRLDEAEEACAALLSSHPDFAPGTCERAELLGRLGRAMEAQTLFARLLVRDAGFVPAYRGMARLAEAAGDLDAAARHMRAAARIRPDDTGLRIECAALAKRAGRWDEARAVLSPLLCEPEAALTARLELHSCVKRDEGALAARTLLDEALVIDPAHPRAVLMLGDHHREAGDLDAAEAAYDAALAARPGFYWALAGKAAVARARGDAAGAIGLLERAIAADPVEGHASLELATLHRETGDFAAAQVVLAGIPVTTPRARQAAAGLGLVLRAQGRWLDAAEAFSAAARRFSGFVEALVEASDDLLRAGRDAQSDAVLAEASRKNPEHPAVLDAHTRRALARDDLDAARVWLERASACDPGRLWPWLAAARLRATRGDAHGALADLAACAARFGSRPEIALAHIEILTQVGEMTRAREELAQARDRFPHHGGLRQQVVLAAIADGAFGEAEAIVAKALARTAPNGADAGRLHFLRSLVAAARWDFNKAIEAGEAAVASLPGDGWVRNRLIHAALLDLDLERAGRHLAALAGLEAGANRAKGKSGNASQSHYGQIFDEFRLDRQALEAVRRARGRPVAERLEALGQAVDEFPDATAPAIAFFIERQRLPAVPAPAHVSLIPRTIHQYWNDPAPPNDLARYAATWREANPGFDYRLWNEAEARAFIGEVAPNTLAAFERANEPAMKADLFRLVLLYEHGGVYADMDDRCLAGIAPLLSAGHAMVAYQEDIGSLGNNFVAARACHPIVERALQLATKAIDRGDTDILWLATGPGLLTRAAAWVLRESPAESDSLMVLDRHVLARHVSIHCLAGYKATERHWSRTAFGRARGPRGAQAARSGAA